MIGPIKQQVKDLAQELNRVDWPEWPKVMGSSRIVVMISVIVGLYLWGADYGFGYLFQGVFKLFIP